MRGNFPSSKMDQFMLRFPDGMRQKFKAMAALNRRSLNSEVIFHLERALASAAATAGASFAGATPAVASDKTALAGGPINQR